MVAVAHERDAHALGPRKPHRGFQCAHPRHRPEGIASVDLRHRPGHGFHLGPRARIDAADADALAIGFDAGSAVRVVAEEVAQHQDPRGVRRVRAVHAEAGERSRGELSQPRFVDHALSRP